MSQTTTLAALREACGTAIELRSLSTSALDRMINRAIKRLHRFIARENKDFFAESSDFNVVHGQESYSPLPARFFRLNGVDLLAEDGRYRPIRPYPWEDRSRCAPMGSARGATRYLLQGLALRLAPAPAWSATAGLRVHYIPTPPVLSDAIPGTTDVWDTVAGFDEAVVLQTCVYFCAVEESDPSIYLAELAQVREDIAEAVRARDASEPDRIRRARRTRHWAWDDAVDGEEWDHV